MKKVFLFCLMLVFSTQFYAQEATASGVMKEKMAAEKKKADKEAKGKAAMAADKKKKMADEAMMKTDEAKAKKEVADVVKMGDVFQVKYLGVDPKTKKEKVSKKALIARPPREAKQE